LATIVSSARGSVAQAIILFEAGLGLGIAGGRLWAACWGRSCGGGRSSGCRR
jgi:hypothetical protein